MAYTGSMRILTVGLIALSLLWAAQAPRKISFARAGVGPLTMQLFISAADGSDEHSLLTVPQGDYDAVWAPDGKSLVFTSDRNGSEISSVSIRMAATSRSSLPTRHMTIRPRSLPMENNSFLSARGGAGMRISGHSILPRSVRRR